MESWLKTIDYNNLTASAGYAVADALRRYTAYSLSGVRVLTDAESVNGLPAGLYIINGKKAIISE